MPRKPTTVPERVRAAPATRSFAPGARARGRTLGPVCGRKLSDGHTQRQARAWRRANLRSYWRSLRT